MSRPDRRGVQSCDQTSLRPISCDYPNRNRQHKQVLPCNKCPRSKDDGANYSKHKPALPLYTIENAQRALDQLSHLDTLPSTNRIIALRTVWDPSSCAQPTALLFTALPGVCVNVMTLLISSRF